MSIIKDINDLVNAGVISTEVAENIHDYYQKKSGGSTNRLFIVFGILGAILVGLGIILILAHNWDEFHRNLKTFFAFLPLIVGQILCGFVLAQKSDSVAWRESASAFLFFAVGASISLVSQIYNIPGNFNVFLMTWMLLCLPLVYLMRSSITSLLYLMGITHYATQVGYFTYPTGEPYWYWLMLLLLLPHYYLLYKNSPKSNFTIFHHWMFPLSLMITLGSLAHSHDELMFIAYISLFSLFFLLGNTPYFQEQRSRNNAYLIIGSMGTLGLLLILSFDWFWKDLRGGSFSLSESLLSPEALTVLLLSLFAGGLLYLQQKDKPLHTLKPIALVFLFFIVIFLIGLVSPLAVLLVNLLVFGIGIMTILDGARQDHLGILNYGLLMIAALVTCRFFDADLSFVLRGVLFLLVGVGFFLTNYWMLKKRNANEE